MSRSLKSLTPLIALPMILAGCGGNDDTRCRKESGIICTLAGTGVAGLGAEREPATQTELYLPQDTSVGPDGMIYVVDWNNHRIRTIDEDGRTETVIGTGMLGDAQDGPALESNFNHPTHVAFDPVGRLVLSAWHNSKVMGMDLTSGRIETLCGNGKRSYAGDDGPASAAVLDLPVNTAFARDGSMYISDQANQRIRKVGPDGIIRTVVGTGEAGFAGDGGPATQAMIQAPRGQAASPSGKIALSATDELFIADSGNNRVRRVNAEGIIDTIAGTGVPGFAGDGSAASAAELSRPTDLAFDAEGNLYLADTDNSCVRKIDPAGTITTAAGVCGQDGFEGDDGQATEALLYRPFGIDVDRDGNLYIADTYNHRIRIVYR